MAGLSARSPSAGSNVNVPAEGGKCQFLRFRAPLADMQRFRTGILG